MREVLFALLINEPCENLRRSGYLSHGYLKAKELAVFCTRYRRTLTVLYEIDNFNKSYNLWDNIIMAIIHKKVWREYFDKIISGKKRMELRLADFEVNEGDTLVLEEWNEDKKKYTGRKIEVVATYIFKTKGQVFWPKEDVEKYGFQIIQFEPKD